MKRRRIVEWRKRLDLDLVIKINDMLRDATPKSFRFHRGKGQFIDPIKKLQRRDCFAVLEDYLERGYTGKIFILYGLRRTGKTTLL